MSYPHHQSIRPVMLLLHNRAPPPQSPLKEMLCSQVPGDLLPHSVVTPSSPTFFCSIENWEHTW